MNDRTAKPRADVGAIVRVDPRFCQMRPLPATMKRTISRWPSHASKLTISSIKVFLKATTTCYEMLREFEPSLG